MKKGLLLSLLCLAVLPSGAEAVTLVTPDGRVAEPYQTWANASKVPTTKDIIIVIAAPCPSPAFTSAQGCTFNDLSAIYIHPTATTPRQTFLHELGHVGIARWFRYAHYRAFGHIFRWKTFDHELAAEAYSLCAVKRRLRTAVGGSYNATPRQHKRACDVFRHSASATGL